MDGGSTAATVRAEDWSDVSAAVVAVTTKSNEVPYWADVISFLVKTSVLGLVYPARAYVASELDFT